MITLSKTDPNEGSLRDLAPDLTPMLDILFILLVFFMLTAGAVFQTLDLKLPSSVSEDIPVLDAPKHIMLEIHADTYALNGTKITEFDALKAAVHNSVQKKPDVELVIAGDRDVPMHRLLAVLTHLQSEGIAAANILMKQPTH